MLWYHNINNNKTEINFVTKKIRDEDNVLYIIITQNMLTKPQNVSKEKLKDMNIIM